MKNLPVKEGDYYINESGLLVFTEQYHRRRGYCCGNGCRHCPYDYENVPEHKRKEVCLKNGRPGKPG